MDGFIGWNRLYEDGMLPSHRAAPRRRAEREARAGGAGGS